jgi:hypothetical protein
VGVPRAGWRLPLSDRRLSDHISIGVLTRVYPPEVVDAVIAAAGRAERRHRLLPARVTAYYVLALALFAQSSYEEVMRFLVEGLSWQSGWARAWRVPTKGAIFQARQRLGVEPLRALFEGTARPLATEATRGAWLREWRLMSLDGTCLDVADSPENALAFGRPGSWRSESGGGAFPQLRLVGLCEVGTHAIVDAVLSPYARHERELALEVRRSLAPGMLVIADRGFFSHALWRELAATGADLLWRATLDLALKRERELPDGSYLATLASRAARRTADAAPLRVVEYHLDDDGRAGQERYRLVTTILDPDAATASELATAYAQRWEVESAFGELKTHQRGARAVLRSKLPDGALQEAYGHLCTHYAIRKLMHEAALTADLDPDRLSFLRSLRVARRTTGSHPGFSP